MRSSAATIGSLWACLLLAPPADALPPGLEDQVVIDGLKRPTSVAFATDGRIFVTEKSGVVLSFRNRADPDPEVVADLRTQVHSFYERGMLAVALDPAFPARPHVYVSYTYDGAIGGPAPLWGRPEADADRCLRGEPDLSFELGCPVAGRVSRLTLDRRGRATSERVLLEDWCQQFPSHSVGEIAFDERGALLVGGGDGAYFNGPDTGSLGFPANACADPPLEGGALRSQDLLTPADPVTLSGTVSRINPDNGRPAAGNPSKAPGNRGRIIAFGLRNPFRFALRPGTKELWIGDVGWDTSEEIDLTSTDRRRNFGWPCFEGSRIQPRYRAQSTPICSRLQAKRKATTKPWFSYRHGSHVVRGEECPAIPPGAISGIAFDQGYRLPLPFDGALFFADFTRNCIWSIEPGSFGEPDRSTLRAFQPKAGTPIDLESGPGGLYYVDLVGGEVHRIAAKRQTAEIRLRSNPAGVPMSLDSRREAAGAEVTAVAGSLHRLRAPERYRSGQRRFTFERWSDGGARRRLIRPAAGTTYTAIYRCESGCGRR